MTRCNSLKPFQVIRQVTQEFVVLANGVVSGNRDDDGYFHKCNDFKIYYVLQKYH